MVASKWKLQCVSRLNFRARAVRAIFAVSLLNFPLLGATFVLKNEVLDDEGKTLGECGVEAGSQVNAVSQTAAVAEE